MTSKLRKTALTVATAAAAFVGVAATPAQAATHTCSNLAMNRGCAYFEVSGKTLYISAPRTSTVQVCIKNTRTCKTGNPNRNGLYTISMPSSGAYVAKAY